MPNKYNVLFFSLLQKKNKRKEKLPDSGADPLGPGGLDDDDDVARLAKEMEEKYVIGSFVFAGLSFSPRHSLFSPCRVPEAPTPKSLRAGPWSTLTRALATTRMIRLLITQMR